MTASVSFENFLYFKVFVGTKIASVEATLVTKIEIQSQLYFCHGSSQSRSNVTDSETLFSTVPGPLI